jgi:TPR repeat protein
MANLPVKEATPEPVAPSYPPDAPLLEKARNALREGVDAAGAVALAKSLPDKPEKADASFILLEYAAESDHAGAALQVGRYYDPNYKGPRGTIQEDPVAAYEWYQQALAGGQEKAKEYLKELRRWAETEAAQGSAQAKALLRIWP